jgi:hypothetical protein
MTQFMPGEYVIGLNKVRIHLGVDKPIAMDGSHGGMLAQQFAFPFMMK